MKSKGLLCSLFVIKLVLVEAVDPWNGVFEQIDDLRVQFFLLTRALKLVSQLLDECFEVVAGVLKHDVLRKLVKIVLDACLLNTRPLCRLESLLDEC